MKKVEDEKMKHQKKQTMEHITQKNFLANMSHEIRTPLNTIVGMNEMILRENKDSGIENYALTIKKSSRQLLALVEDILDFSMLDDGNFECQMAEYQLSSLLNDVIMYTKQLSERKGLKTLLEIDENLPSELMGDPIAIKKIIHQLISNAVKYTEVGTITLSVSYEKVNKKEIELIIAVKDTGKGIKEEDRQRLFEKFTKLEADKCTNIAGTGLGLAIVKKLVDKFNGKIEVQSIFGVGSVFTVQIKQKVISDKCIGNIQEIYETISIDENLYGRKEGAVAEVLAVDDNEMNLVVIEKLLKKTRINIDRAYSGSEALFATRIKKYDLILMDHMMPKPDGIESLHILRNEQGNPNQFTDVIVVTANAVAGSRERYIKEGFCDYLAKPIFSDELQKMLKKYLPADCFSEDAGSKEIKESLEQCEIKEDIVYVVDRRCNSFKDYVNDVIDIDTGLMYSAEDEDLYEEIVKAYYDQGENYQSILKKAYEDKDWEQMRITAHAIKSTSLSIGATGCHELAKAQEFAARDFDEKAINENWDRFFEAYRGVIVELEKMLEFVHTQRGSGIKKISETEIDDISNINKMFSGMEDEKDKRHVLVIDDDKSNLVIADRLLGQEYNVALMDSGKNIIPFVRNNIVDLILLDIQMPDIDGFEIMEQLKKDEVACKIPVIFLTADRDEKTEERCLELGANDFITKPFIPAIMIQRVRKTIELENYRQNLEKMVENQLQRITNLQRDIILTMANLIEGRDGTTGEHVKRVSGFTDFLVEKLLKKNIYPDVIDRKFADYIKKAAPLHDLGKITIPDSILQKPGKLTDEEYEMIKQHAPKGGELIRQNMSQMVEPEFLQIAYDVATYHHEKWNGKGYPKGLSATEIPLSARIVAIADVFDALVAKRQYKEGMSLEKAVSIMEEERGKGFEPELLDTFIEDREDLQKVMDRLVTVHR